MGIHSMAASGSHVALFCNSYTTGKRLEGLILKVYINNKGHSFLLSSDKFKFRRNKTSSGLNAAHLAVLLLRPSLVWYDK